MKILTVLGARPQFIKAAPVSRALAVAGHDEVIIHTGQHYSDRLSDIFFREMGIQQPNLNLGVGSASHAEQTAAMLVGLEHAVNEHGPDWVLVYGDTNSTLAGALAACKLGVPLAHVESGLRSFNRSMPEEHNRILTDHAANLLLCPTQTALDNLAREGLAARTVLVGDTMLDALVQFLPIAQERSSLLSGLGLERGGYVLATIHRPYNTDDPVRLAGLLGTLAALDDEVVLPLHPRTRDRLGPRLDSDEFKGIRFVEPLGYLDMLAAESGARLIMTDSGGIQKEAYFLEVPCVTLRPETEWVETVDADWNVVVGRDPERIRAAAARTDWPTGTPPPVFGSGHASEAIVAALTTESTDRSA